ncbi:oxidation resistance protein 1-like isoform X6 [Daphnia pulicaria]|uniref:oxidation resistance protein 1-like isoform X6 n=1 Tax=Daphnia pulicaria TaxID=35523 RepID=UPI001EEB00B5|nr:oxidation resistance protein 1-like isoform X6 [Daphnia pulicaria]XP_046644631.1 oxidation resistance protein 1-like isoform X6 [Daphnia pulicaria]
MTSSDHGLTGPQRQRSIKDRLKDGLSSWQTKSRSVDQSLAAAFDVDVIGGLSRLAGSALGSSTDSGGGGRPGSPIGERRSSGSGGSNSRLAEDTLAYTVQSNDTLTSLAARFDTTPSELVAINKLHSRLIFPGQVLLVPRKDADANRGAGLESEGAGTSSSEPGEAGTALGPQMALNVSIRSSSSNSNINEVGRDSNGGYSSPTAERPIEHAFLDSLRPPGSPRFNRVDLSFTNQGSGAGQSGSSASDFANIEREINNEELLTSMDVETERIRDRSAYEKFLKIHVRHITDGQGVVAGVLLVTPNTVMFDPNVSDTLVIEHGAEAYGVIAPMEFVVNAALYPDIAHMRLADSKGQPDQPITDPIYFPTNCPLHRKYSILKEKAHLKGKQTSQEEAVVDLDPAAGILAIAGDIQRRWSEGEDTRQSCESQATAQEDDAAGSSKTSIASPLPAPSQSLPQEPTPKDKETRANSLTAESVDGAVVTVVSEPLCPIVPPPSVVEAAHQSGHVIRLHVKNEPLVPSAVADVAAGPAENDLVDKSSLSSDNTKLTSGIRVVSSMDKTPSGEREDELCISEELNVTDDDDKDEAFHSSAGSGYEQAISEAMIDESEYRARHFSVGTTSSMGPHQSGAARSRAMHSSFHRQPRHASGGSEPIPTSRPQSSSPAPIASSPESRGQRMLKRLSYPLVWMGESLTADSKENSPVLPADKDPNAESVFSKVFSSNHPDHSVELSCDNSMVSQTTPEESLMIPDFSEFIVPDRSGILLATAAAISTISIAIGTIDGARRLSTENSLKLDSRLVPNLFRGKDQGHHHQQQHHQHHHNNPISSGQPPAGAQPKLGYRSMVSVDDVPELFASLDILRSPYFELNFIELIPKPAQPCDAPPLYLRLRMGKPLNRKGGMTTPIMSYGKKKMKPEYWFSIPRDKADSLCRFFLLWSPDVYGEPGDAESVAKRGFELITEDLEWEEPSPVRRTKPVKKAKGQLGGKSKSGDHDQVGGEDEDDPLGVTAELAKESWERAKAPYVRLFTILKTQATLFESDQDEIVSLNEEVRRALYGSERLSALDLDSYLPDLIGPTEVLTDEYRKQLAKHLPARVEGYPWSLVFSTSQNGFSLNSLYRKMIGIDSPILLVIEDTQGNVFGAITSCEIRVSESFYGTGESLLFVINPKMQIYPWSGDNSYFIQGNNESLAIGAGDGRFGLWLDGDLNQGRTQTCKTFGNDPLSPDEDFWVKTLECWAFM